MLLRCLPARSSITIEFSCSALCGSRNAARERTVGNRKRSVIASGSVHVSHNSSCARTMSSECPPRSKKLSCAPTVSIPRTRCQTCAISLSRRVRGGTNRPSSMTSDSLGAGSRRRSTLPLALSGNASRTTTNEGRKYSGSLSRKYSRSVDTKRPAVSFSCGELMYQGSGRA